MSKELVETTMSQLAPASTRRSLLREFDRLLDRMGSAMELPTMERFFEGALGQPVFAPAIEVAETKDEYKLTAEVPGLDPAQVDVSVAGGMLVIKGEKKREVDKNEAGLQFSERSFGSFRRSFRLPDDVDASGIEADHRNGVLTIRLPKTSEAKEPQKIEVKSAS